MGKPHWKTMVFGSKIIQLPYASQPEIGNVAWLRYPLDGSYTYVFRSMLNFCSFSKKCFSGLRAIISALEQFLLFWCFSSFSITNHHFSPSIPSHSLGSLGESPLTALAAKIRHLKEACPFFFSCTDLHRMSPSSATGIQPRQAQHGEGHHLRCVWRTKGGGKMWEHLMGFPSWILCGSSCNFCINCLWEHLRAQRSRSFPVTNTCHDERCTGLGRRLTH